MLRLLLLAALLLPGFAWAQINAAANLEIPNPPLRSQSAFSGLMFRNDTEFLTPEGILDTLPPQTALYDTYSSLEPAAGPEDPSPTAPSPTLPHPVP